MHFQISVRSLYELPLLIFQFPLYLAGRKHSGSINFEPCMLLRLCYCNRNRTNNSLAKRNRNCYRAEKLHDYLGNRSFID